MGRDPKGDEERERRFRLATASLQAGDLEQATDEFVWLWRNITYDYPALVGVRVSYMAGQIAELTRRHRRAHDAFRRLRDNAGDQQSPFFDRVDWITLNEALGEPDKTFSWIDDCLAKGQIELLRGSEHWVYRCLVGKKRWKDAGTIVANPPDRVRFLLALEEGTEESPEERRRELRAHILRELATLVRTLRAARRSKEAAEVLRQAVTFDTSVRNLARSRNTTRMKRTSKRRSKARPLRRSRRR